MKTLAERIQSRMDELGLGQEALAKKAGISQTAVFKLVSGKTLQTRKIAELAKALNVSIEWLATGVGEKHILKPVSNAEWMGGFELWDNETPLPPDEVALPFFREVKLSAGPGSTEVIQNHGCTLRFARSTLKKQSVQPEHAYCVTVKGNSMEPVLPDGCTIGIDTGSTDVVSGEWYAIDHLGELRVKVVYKQPGGGYRLRSFNIDEWPDELVSADSVKILGRVFWYAGLR